MTNPPEQPDSSNLDAYLDGALPAKQQGAMKREIETNPELRAEVELQGRIDESLRRSFAPSKPPAELLAVLLAAGGSSASTPPTLRNATGGVPYRWRRWLAIAGVAVAATIVWAVVGWQFFAGRGKTPNYDPNTPLETIYATSVADGFKPKWVCDEPHEFASTFKKRQGQGLLLAAMPPGIKMEGLHYLGGLSRYTTAMLARVDGKPVLVLVDKSSEDKHPAEPSAKSGLHLFRKELGPLVLYELTPLDRPSVMDYLYQADVPPATK
jgi:hypothetical protein